MEKLTNLEKAMLEVIKHRRITRKELMRVFNIESRECMAIIRKLRKVGYPIIASKSSTHGGFYMAVRKDELEKWISDYYRGVNDMAKIFNTMRGGFE